MSDFDFSLKQRELTPLQKQDRGRFHITNLRLMPQDGNYIVRTISNDEFYSIIRENSHRLLSHIGYIENVMLIREHSGVQVEVHEAYKPFHKLEDGDQILCMSLKTAQVKPFVLTRDSFKYSLAQYQKPDYL